MNCFTGITRVQDFSEAFADRETRLLSKEVLISDPVQLKLLELQQERARLIEESGTDEGARIFLEALEVLNKAIHAQEQRLLGDNKLAKQTKALRKTIVAEK